MLLADITKAFEGSELSLATLAATYAQEHGFAKSVLICFPDQQSAIASVAKSFEVSPIQGPRDWRTVAGIVADTYLPAAIGQPTARLCVISFHVTVLALATRVPPERRKEIEFFHWKQLTQGNPIPRVEEPPLDLEAFPLSKAQILSCLESALSRVRGPVWITSLRHLLAREDEAFDKHRNPTSSKLIPEVVKMGEAARLIDADYNRRPSNVLISLRRTRPSTDHIAAAYPRSTYAPSVAPSLQTIAHSVPAAPIVPDARGDGQRMTRSQVFLRVLAEEHLGPFAAVRLALYDAIEQLATAKQYSVGATLRRAVSTAEAANPQAKIPWYYVTQFLFRLLSLAKVFVDAQGKPLDPNSPRDVATVVHGLTPEWRDEADGVIVLAIIAADGRVAAHDIVDIAGCLYNRRTEDECERVGVLLQRLEKAKKIGVGAGGKYTALTPRDS